MKIEIDCTFSDDQLGVVHKDLSEARAQCNNVQHQASLVTAIRLIDQLRTQMKARGGFRP
jgi:hypothetical protein